MKHPPVFCFKKNVPEATCKFYYYRKQSAASLLKPEDVDADYIAGAAILHVTGITPALSTSCLDTVRRVIQIAKENGVKISLDPNIRLKLWSPGEARETLLELARHADFILNGLDEGELLIGLKQPEKIAEYLLDIGSKAVVVKLGSQAYYQTSEEYGYVKGFHVTDLVAPGMDSLRVS
jgi:2-dehydro-3-deoxygluconokinase